MTSSVNSKESDDESILLQCVIVDVRCELCSFLSIIILSKPPKNSMKIAVSSQLRLFFALATLVATGAFAPNVITIKTSTTTNNEKSSVALFESKKPKKGGLDEGVRNKLLSESIAPWRTLRLFLYGSLGSGAFVGGLINISGAVAGSASPDFNLNTEVRRSRLYQRIDSRIWAVSHMLIFSL